MNYENRNFIGYLKDSVEAIEAQYPGKEVGDLVHDALVRQVNLSETSATELGNRIHNLIVRTFKRGGKLARVNAKALQRAANEINSMVTLDWKFDLEYLAGYSKENALKIYIDRDIQRLYTLSSGRVVDIARYLAVHEVIEKSLLNELKLTERGYQRTHQLAQRIEQDLVRADGITWREYQSNIMGPYIKRSVTKKVLNTPPDLDLVMYTDLNDPDLEKKILPALTIPRSISLHSGESRRVGDLFEVREVIKDVFYLRFDNAESMANTMMRFQEFFDSPKFRGTYFSREEFEEWYKKEHESTYVKDWGGYGFNVSNEALKPFYEGHFAPLIFEEKHILDFFSDRTEPFYIIATSSESSHEMIGHEIAHALYFVNADYKREVDGILATTDIEPLKHFLRTAPGYGGYHDEVLQDEVHAYLSQTTEELQENGFDIAPYADATKRLRAVYEKYASGIASLPR